MIAQANVESFGDELAGYVGMKRKTKKQKEERVKVEDKAQYFEIANRFTGTRDEDEKRQLREKLARTTFGRGSCGAAIADRG